MNFQGQYKLPDSWNKPLSNRPPSSAKSNKSLSRDKKSNLSRAGQNIMENLSNNYNRNPIPNQIPDALNTKLARNILKQFEAEIPPAPYSVKSERKINTPDKSSKKLPPRPMRQDENLLTAMTGKLRQTQSVCNAQRQQLKQKNYEIEKLKKQNSYLKINKKQPQKILDQFQTLEKQNQDLKKKVNQMEAYLKKNGLKWVGSQLRGKLDSQKIKKDLRQPKFNYRMPAQIDIQTIRRRVQELNQRLQSQGKGSEVYMENGIHKFKPAEPLPMAFYKNGIALKGYNFLAYNKKQSLKFLGDLVDGYFPYILKNKYPDGVFFKVMDKISEQFDESAVRSQQGHKIGGMDNANSNKQFLPPTKEQYLNSLPKNVIKNGKVIPIRGQIEKMLDGPQLKSIEQDDQFLFQNEDGNMIFKTTFQQKFQKSQVQDSEISILKIRNQKGQICILHLPKSSSVKTIYQWVRKVTKSKFIIKGNYPRRDYEQEEKQTLEELGLYPTASLHLQLL